MHTSIQRLALSLAIIFVGVTALAQQPENSMPGMNMPPASQKPAQSPAASQKPGQNTQVPGDMRDPPPGNKPAQAESRSMRSSEKQQNAQPAQAQGAAADSASLTRNTAALQEAENPDLHTGADLPAPDLLRDVAGRPSLRIEQFEDWAMSGHPTLPQARALAGRSEGQAHQAGLPPDPIVAYDGEHIRGGSYGGGEQGAYVQQTLVLGGKLSARRDIYKRQADADRAVADEQVLRVRDDVTQAFYRALTSQAMVVLRQRLLGTATDAAATAHELANVGQADAPDVLGAQVEAEEAKINFSDAQRTFLRDFRTLAVLANQPGLAPSPLTGDLENPPQIEPEELVDKMVTDSPSVLLAQKLVAVSEARLKDSRRESIPDLQLRAGEWWSGEQVNGSNKAAGPESFASAAVDLPLWNRNQGNKDAAAADLQRARANVLRTQLDLRRRAAPLAEDYLSARFAAERYKTQLIPRARRACELYALKYTEMAGAYPQVLVSQRTLFDLQASYLRALERQWAAAIALQNSTLQGALDEPMTTAESTTALNLPTATQ